MYALTTIQAMAGIMLNPDQENLIRVETGKSLRATIMMVCLVMAMDMLLTLALKINSLLI